MINKFSEEVTMDDVKFTCFIIEKTARLLNQLNEYVVDSLGYDGIEHLLNFATMLHNQNFNQTCSELIQKYTMLKSSKKQQRNTALSEMYMARLYSSLIWEINDGDLVQSVIDVYHSPICKIIDDPRTSAHYEPLPVIVRAYYEGTF